MVKLRTLKVLLVEDNLDDIRILRRALATSKAVALVHIARDGQEALDYLFGQTGQAEETDPGAPDLILLDLNLPRVNGLEVLKRLRSDESLDVIPVIMLTSSSRVEDIARCYKSGSNTYIQKPVEFGDFLQALAVLEDYWTGLAKLPTLNAA
jgi:two-component system response regulator